MKRETFGLILAAFAGAAVAADVKDLSVVQDPSSKLVTISFSLEEKSIVTMDVLTNGVSIGAENYRSVRDAQSAGTAFPANRIVAAGPHVWTWKPRRDWPDRHFENGELSVIVTAWSLDDPPDYMVLTCNATSNAPSFYARVEDLPDGGIKTADPDDAEAVEALKQDVYRTSKLVLRKIPADGVKWRMGSPTDEANRQANEVPHYVTLTNDYYVSIYPLTFTQARVLLGTEDSVNVNICPKYNYQYTEGRGNYSTSFSWPDDGYAVTSGSGFGKMRARTGLRFDFLTEAEWEYACRAGTEGRWNDDGSSPDAVAWTSYTGEAKGHVVGLKKPNAWGLYDMHGLVQEWVLDQYGPYPTAAVIAPVGVSTNVTKRILRGGPKAVKNSSGSYSSSANISTRSAYRTSDTGSNRYDGNNNGYGVRVGCPAVLPDWLRK